MPLLTVKVLSVETVSSEKTVQTQIRLLLKEQSDQDLHCLPFDLHLLAALLHCKTKLIHFMTIAVIDLSQAGSQNMHYPIKFGENLGQTNAYFFL